MFKFLKRAFINNDKKKDEIILSDIYIDKIQVIFYLFLLEEKQKQL